MRLLEYVLEGVVDLCAPCECRLEVRRTDGHDHELLEVHVVIRMHTTIEDVHHGGRQGVGVHAAQIGVKGLADRTGSCTRSRQRASQDGVSTKLGLVVGAVGCPKCRINGALLGSLKTNDGLTTLTVCMGYGLQDAFAHVTILIAITHLDGLELAR